MKINMFVFVLLLSLYMFVAQITRAENIHFNNNIYILKTSNFSEINKGYENYYFLEEETGDNWSRTIEIFDYPEIKNPVKFAENADKEIETKSSVLLLKFIANKKQEKAVLSFIDIGEINGKAFVEHNIYKYEPGSNKGMMILRYAKRYFANTKEETTKIAQEIKNINDDLMEQIIISPIPPIVEKDM